jgi:aminoglycoside 6'-N-acetyltransferase I
MSHQINSKSMSIVEIVSTNLKELTALTLMLWKECDYTEELENSKAILKSKQETAFLLEKQQQYIGFILLSMRTDYVEGTRSTPVAYIEGLFIIPKQRKRGYAQMLVDKGEQWGKNMGCLEYASDTKINNHISIQFHQQCGFKEAKRIVCFSKAIK